MKPTNINGEIFVRQYSPSFKRLKANKFTKTGKFSLLRFVTD